MDGGEVLPNSHRRNYDKQNAFQTDQYGSSPPRSGKLSHFADTISAADFCEDDTERGSSASLQSLSIDQKANDSNTRDERSITFPHTQIFDTVEANLTKSTTELIGSLDVWRWCKELNAKVTVTSSSSASHVDSPQTIYTVHGTFESISELQRLCSEQIRRAPTTFTSTQANSCPSATAEPTSTGTDCYFNDMKKQQIVSSPTAKSPTLSATRRSSKQTQEQDVEETQDDTPMEFTSTTYEYVEKFMQQELKTIMSQCGVSVRHELKSDGFNARIYVQAVRSDTRRAKQRLAALFREVSHSMSEARFEIPLDVEAEVSQLNTSELKTLVLMEKNHTCVILGKQQDVDRTKAEVKKLMKGQSKAECFGFTYSLPHGRTVDVMEGDITQQDVDVIVNAANERLEHAGGVARAICKAGGEEIEQQSKNIIHQHGRIKEAEAVYTEGGKMKCKYVVHTVPPQWDVHRRRPEDLTRILQQACHNSLKLASKLKASSIAIPGLGSGVFGIPKDVCARTLLITTSNFFQQYGTQSPLKRIVFIDIDPITVQAIKDQYSQVFHRTGTYPKQ